MRTKLSLTLTDATAIAAAAEEYAESRELRVSIAVVDESTYIQHVVRMDGAPYMSAEGAIEKARTAAEGGHPTTFFEEPLNAGRYSMLKMPHIYSLLASRGFATIALAYFGAPGLPDKLVGIEVEAVERAIRWLDGRADVSGDRVAVIGGSRGGELALLAGSLLKQIGGGRVRPEPRLVGRARRGRSGRRARLDVPGPTDSLRADRRSTEV